MSFLNTLLVFCSLSILSFSNAKADAFFEPSVGYRSESIKLTDKLNNQSKATIASPVYGLKFGFRSMMGIDVNLAGDYSTGKAKMSPITEENNYNHTTVAAQLGISALGLMKIYLGYGFLNELKIDAGALNSDMKFKGAAYQAGVQFKLVSDVYAGAQYAINQFTTVEGKSFAAGSAIDTYYSKVDSQDLILSLSLVF